MSFVAELRQELVEAAEREQARRVPRLGSPSPRLVVAVAAAAVMALALVLAAAALNPRPVDDREPRPAVTPTPDARPLFGGTLVPDVRYVTSEFVPKLSFVVADDRWMAADTTLSDELRLVRVKRGAPGPNPPRIRQLLFLRISEVADPSVRGLEASRSAAPPDLHEWLSDHPDLRVGATRPVTIAKVPGERFRLRPEFDRPAHVDPWCARYTQFTCALIAPGLNWPDGAHVEMIVLRTEPQPLVIALFGISAGDLAAVEKAAAPVFESLQIGVR